MSLMTTAPQQRQSDRRSKSSPYTRHRPYRRRRGQVAIQPTTHEPMPAGPAPTEETEPNDD